MSIDQTIKEAAAESVRDALNQLLPELLSQHIKPPEQERLIVRAEVCEMLAINPKMVSELIEVKRFPRPIELNGARSQRWVMSEVVRWIRQQQFNQHVA